MKKISAILLFITVCLVSRGMAITLDQALSEAESNSEELQIAIQAANEATAKAKGVTAFTLPQISLEVGYSGMGSDRYNPFDPFLDAFPVEMTSISDEIFDEDDEKLFFNALQYQYGSLSDAADESYKYFEIPDQQGVATLRVNQILYAGGNITKSWQLKKKMISQAQLAVRVKRNEIRQKVKTAFQKVLLLDSNLKILKDRVAQREEELDDARALLNAGLVTSLDLRHTKLKINFALDDLKAGEVNLTNALIDFNSILGRQQNRPLLIPKGVLERGWDLSSKISELQKRFYEKNLVTLETKAMMKDIADLNQKMAQGEYFPKIILSGSDSYTMNEIEDYNSWNAGVMMSWNLFSGNANKSKKMAAISAARKAETELQKAENDIGTFIKQIGEQAKVLDYRIGIQQEALSLAAENYNDARGNYRAGTMTQTQVNEFDLAYSEVRFKLQSLYFMERELEIQVEALLE